MKNTCKVGLFVFLGFGITHTFLKSASSASSSRPTRSPRAVLGAVPINGIKGSARVVLSAENPSNTLLLVSPDKRWLFYRVQREGGKKWEWGIIDPSNADRSIKYTGPTSNGFLAYDVVWSPQSNEVAVGLGYRTVAARWVRVGVAKYDPEAAKICSDMASTPGNEVEDIVSKGGYSPSPVWGTDGQYYPSERLARRDNVVTFQSRGVVASRDPASRLDMSVDGRNYTVLLDNIGKMAHAFKDGRYVESFPVAGRTVKGWWLLSRGDGQLIAARQFPVAIDSKGTATVKPSVRTAQRWVGIDIGTGRIVGVYEIARGILIRIQRDKMTEVVFVETPAAKKSLK